MAVNFPDSPSNGDTFVVGSLTYTYTASTDVWDASGVTSAAIQISDTAPSNPSDGELWHNSSDLKLYIYYNDGSSSQWVVASPQQIGPAGPGGSFSGTVSQSIIPDTDSAYDLGSATHKFRSLYLSSDTLYLGDSASISAGSGGEIILPSLKIGTGANAVRLEADASGKLKTKKVVGGVTQAAEEPGNATVVTDMAGLIAVTGMSAGQTALVTALNKVFMYTGSAWYLIATMTNASPTDITGVNSTYSLATDGTATTITAVSTDPEGFALTWSYAVTTGSLGSTATVSQADNVFTITPSTTEADAGEFSITFSVTDGATGAVNAVSAFTLSFETIPQTLSQSILGDVEDARLGMSVSVSDSYAIAGEPYWQSSSGQPRAGRVKIYNPSSGATLYTLANPAGSSAASQFGISVGICEQFAIVGSRLTGSNKAYIYNPSTGALLFTLSNPDPDSSGGQDEFGSSVAITNGYAIVGAKSENSQEGKSYIFSTSTGNLLHTLTRSGDSGSINTNPYFGVAVDISPTYSIVGADKTDISGNGGAGRAYVFNNSTGALVHTVVNPTTYSDQSQDWFGKTVAINDTHFIVGASQEDTATVSKSGAAYIFNTVAGTLNRTLVNPTPVQNDYFGFGVSVHGDLVAVAAPGETNGSGVKTGGVYIYRISDGTLEVTLTDPNPTDNNWFSGIDQDWPNIDMNGSYLVVGAPYEDNSSTRKGAVYIYS